METNDAPAVSTEGAVDPNRLPRGDYTDNEILRFRRIRVERQEVLFGDTEPLLCRQGTMLLLAGRGGSLARSNDGGLTWEPFGSLMEPGVPKRDVRALAGLTSGAILAAVQRDSTISVFSSANGGEAWQTVSSIALPPEARDGSARFVELPDATVLFTLGGHLYRSTDGGTGWSHFVSLPTGWTAIYPVVLRSGRLLATVERQSSQKETGAAAQGDESTGNRATSVAESTDGGATWRTTGGVSRDGQIPGDLVELPDGRLVLSYGEHSYPYGARALLSTDGGSTWDSEIYVLGLCRCGIRTQPRSVRCEPAHSVTSIGMEDGVVVSAYDRGRALPPLTPPGDGRKMDEWGNQPAIIVVRWTPDGFKRPPLVYPNLWTHTVDARGYLDNGLVRMRPDDRFEGGDYVENYEMVVYRRLPGEQRFFAGGGAKGVVVCRHPDGSLVFSSRDPSIYRSIDEGRTWTKIAEISRPGNRSSTFAFGVTRKGTFLMGYDTLVKAADPVSGFLNQTHITRSDDGGTTWTSHELAPGPMRYGGRGDGNRIQELSDGTVVMSCGGAWNDPARKAGYQGDVLLRSRDDGQSWGDWTVLPPGSCESNFLELPSGELLCATRYQRDALSEDYFDAPGDKPWPPPAQNLAGHGRFKNEAIMISQDRGYNWSTPVLVTRIHMVSADAVLLRDGRVVLTYDHKDACGGPRGLISPDGGRAWEPHIYLLGYHTSDARTSSVVLRDGRVLTLWAGAQDGGIHSTIWFPE